MATYLILWNPLHKRVYLDAAYEMASAEFLARSKKYALDIVRMEKTTVSGVDGLLFDSTILLDEIQLCAIGELSFVYGIFLLQQSELLQPLAYEKKGFVDEKISSLLKYSGKTNELFTRLLCNLAVDASAFSKEKEALRLLDPIAGKGTTLFEGLVLGYHVAGVEIAKNVVGESQRFFKTYLEKEKYKHTMGKESLLTKDKKRAAVKTTFSFAADKEAWKAGKKRTLSLVAGNALYADVYYKKKFHMIVGDLPYGVQHSNVSEQGQNAWTRNPKELVRTCLPAWKKLLHHGGAIVLSWNTFVLPRKELCEVLEEEGLLVLEEAPYNTLAHRVDQAILRDVIVARNL